VPLSELKYPSNTYTCVGGFSCKAMKSQNLCGCHTSHLSPLDMQLVTPYRSQKRLRAPPGPLFFFFKTFLYCLSFTRTTPLRLHCRTYQSFSLSDFPLRHPPLLRSLSPRPYPAPSSPCPFTVHAGACLTESLRLSALCGSVSLPPPPFPCFTVMMPYLLPSFDLFPLSCHHDLLPVRLLILPQPIGFLFFSRS